MTITRRVWVPLEGRSEGFWAEYDDSPETFNYDGARALWGAVLGAQVSLATAPAPRVPTREQWSRRARQAGRPSGAADYARALPALENECEKRLREQYEARAWLLDGGADMREVCRLAGYEPEYVVRKADEAQRRGWADDIAQQAA